jgi:hypothetical protein
MVAKLRSATKNGSFKIREERGFFPIEPNALTKLGVRVFYDTAIIILYLD